MKLRCTLRPRRGIGRHRGHGGKYLHMNFSMHLEPILTRRFESFSFIILRYAGLIATFPGLFFTSIQSQHCRAAMILSQLGVVLAAAASGGIFCYRVFVLWNGNQIVRGVVSFMYCLMVGCWVSIRFDSASIDPLKCGLISDCCGDPVQDHRWSTYTIWLQLPATADRLLVPNFIRLLCRVRRDRSLVHPC